MIDRIDVVRPAIGDPIVLESGESLSEVRELVGFVWPFGYPEPTAFRVLDPAGLELRVVLANRELRVWHVERRNPG